MALTSYLYLYNVKIITKTNINYLNTEKLKALSLCVFTFLISHFLFFTSFTFLSKCEKEVNFDK